MIARSDEVAIEVAAAHSQLRITEIMYHPEGGDDYEFVELSNIGDTAIDLSGAFFEGIEFTFRYGFPPLVRPVNLLSWFTMRLPLPNDIQGCLSLTVMIKI